MKMTQNTQTKMTDESPVYVDEVTLFHPVEDETEHLREELEAERDKHLRLAAEYKNYRRRTEQENADAADKGKRELLIQLMSIADDLDLALADSNELPEAVAEDLRMIHRRFRGILEANNVIAFESKGEKFDPERHEAFDVVAIEEGESGTVNSEMRRGYFWKSRLLRPALVIVAQ
jgi:molecular chaperone GrpE